LGQQFAERRTLSLAGDSDKDFTVWVAEDGAGIGRPGAYVCSGLFQRRPVSGTSRFGKFDKFGS
jgi:hypothetical protein